MKQTNRTFIFAFLFALLAHFLLAQSSQREIINQERTSEQLPFEDEKMLEKSRRFIRLDSTYYVGFLLQGSYLYFRANDKLGFQQAIEPLARAMNLIENDFDRQLRVRSNNFSRYSKVYPLHFDYCLITYFLQNCYQNVEAPDKAYDVLIRIKDRNIQFEQNIVPYNTLAWIYHRNRLLTSKNYSFLKNSIAENVQLASRYLDSALLKIKKDLPLNAGLFDPTYLNRQYLSTYHYKAIIYDYKLEIDSCNLVYDELIRQNAYSSNNYAEFKMAMGELATADAYFKDAGMKEDGSTKTTKEFYYMQSTLATYRGHPEEGDSLLTEVLEMLGVTPGYGWHNIGLARALHYEGLTNESQSKTNIANNFQELHIGTTWGKEQYNMSISSLNYINQLHYKQEYYFENDEWWFWINPINWYKSITFNFKIQQQKLLLASLVANNPERELVLYSIFASENLINFDEVWSVIDDLGTEYFIKLYKKKLATDKRPAVKKYFRYFLGKLYYANGDKSEAEKYFRLVLNDNSMSDEYQNLLRARIYEGLALSTSADEKEMWTQKFYDSYPQLLPFSELKMKFNLELGGDFDSDFSNEILESLSSCKVDFIEQKNIATAKIQFEPKSSGVKIMYSVKSAHDGKTIVSGDFQVSKDDLTNGGKLLAYRLFGVIKNDTEKIVEPSKNNNPELTSSLVR